MREVRKIPGGTCGAADPGELGPEGPDIEDVLRLAAGAEWAAGEKAKIDADAEDEIVQSLIADLQGVRADIKAAPAGPLTLTRAQLLKIVRAVLWHIKGDKSA